MITNQNTMKIELPDKRTREIASHLGQVQARRGLSFDKQHRRGDPLSARKKYKQNIGVRWNILNKAVTISGGLKDCRGTKQLCQSPADAAGTRNKSVK